MSDNDSNFIKEMAEIFKNQIEEFTVTMPELYENSDFQNLSRLAHKAKSSVAVMGMAREAEILKELELNAKEEKNTESFKEMIDTFIENSKIAIRELDEYLH
jgi:HPt (histidine-containing phosphotransfer) domain-containing protein